MSLPDEKKALNKVNSLRRSRTAVENYQRLQASIDAKRARADALRTQQGSGSKAISDRFDAVRAELDRLRREGDEAFANRGKLYEERNTLQQQLSALHEQRRQSVERFREERDAYWRKTNEDRVKQAERAREERVAQEEQKRIQARERLMEKARAPAFAAEIQDCRSLLEYFSGKGEHASSPTAEPAAERPKQPPGDNHPGAWAGWVPLKKEEEESYFVGGKGKTKKGHRKGAGSTVGGSSKISIPLGILSTLLSLSISPPAVAAEVHRTIEDLRKKLEWYQGTYAGRASGHRRANTPLFRKPDDSDARKCSPG